MKTLTCQIITPTSYLYTVTGVPSLENALQKVRLREHLDYNRTIDVNLCKVRATNCLLIELPQPNNAQ